MSTLSFFFVKSLLLDGSYPRSTGVSLMVTRRSERMPPLLVLLVRIESGRVKVWCDGWCRKVECPSKLEWDEELESGAYDLRSI
jgi:hypothetical protein